MVKECNYCGSFKLFVRECEELGPVPTDTDLSLRGGVANEAIY